MKDDNHVTRSKLLTANLFNGYLGNIMNDSSFFGFVKISLK